MPGPGKITIGQAQIQGAVALVFYCENIRLHCHNRGEMKLKAAIARWGPDLRLDQVPARCEKCGSRDFVDVRAREPRRVNGHCLSQIIEDD